MLQERLTAARTIVPELHDAERQGSTALLGASRLMSTMVTAREGAKLGPVFGQDALDHTAAAIANFTQAMRHLREAHLALNTHRVEAGLGAYMFGDAQVFSPTAERRDGVDESDVRHLHAVG